MSDDALLCWACGKPAPAGVCPGPHEDREWVPRMASNMYEVRNNRQVGDPRSHAPWNLGLRIRQMRRDARERAWQEKRVEWAVSRLEDSLRACDASRARHEAVERAYEVLRREQEGVGT